MNNEEHQIQVAGMELVEMAFWRYWPGYILNLEYKKTVCGKSVKMYRKVCPVFATPNGGHRHAKVARDMRMEGAKSGAWDLTLEIPKGGYSMLKIETKKSNGRLSANQKEWQKFYTMINAKCVVCRTPLEIVNAVVEYMDQS